MDLRGVHHVSLNVTDLAATTAFYTEVLGLEVMANRPADQISVDGTWLSMPDGRELHLLEQATPTSEGQHFAFEVGNVDDVAVELADHGISTTPAKEMTGICRQIFCTDPSGNLVEFNQRL